MKTSLNSKILSVALATAAFAAIGSVPAFAQSADHTGSAMPHYFDASGELKWGGWAPQASAQKAVAPSHHLYLYAKHAHRKDLHS